MRPGALRWLIVALLVMPVFGVVALAVGKLVLARGHKLPVHGEVAEFALTESSGRQVLRADLRGKVWIADFIFTRCAGPCPVMTFRMSRLQADLSAVPDMRFVSFTVDPEYDTPAVLRKYAESAHADPVRWWFLTGEKRQIHELSRAAFHLAVEQSGEEPILHSTKFVLVDQRGRIRGYYDGTDEKSLAALVRDAKTLAAIGKLPALNATLNATSGVALALGYGFIRRKHIGEHLTCMATALVVSAVFLVSYLLYHYHTGSTKFTGDGWVRPVYFAILISHTVLAAVTALALAPVTVYRAARRRFDRHKAIARWTLPVWFYVSVTGVVIYFMLYHWYAPA